MSAPINIYAKALSNVVHTLPYSCRQSTNIIEYNGESHSILKWGEYDRLKDFSLKQLRELAYIILSYPIFGQYKKEFKQYKMVLKFIEKDYLQY